MKPVWAVPCLRSHLIQLLPKALILCLWWDAFKDGDFTCAALFGGSDFCMTLSYRASPKHCLDDLLRPWSDRNIYFISTFEERRGTFLVRKIRVMFGFHKNNLHNLVYHLRLFPKAPAGIFVDKNRSHPASMANCSRHYLISPLTSDVSGRLWGLGEHS